MPDSISPTKPDAPNVLAYSSPPVGSTAAVIGCRLLAICMLGWGIQSSLIALTEVIDYLPRYYNVHIVVVLFLGVTLPAAVWLFLAWYCWAKAPQLAERMARDRTDPLSSHGITADELLSTLLIAIGIYLFAEGIPVMAQLIYLALPPLRSTHLAAAIVAAIIRCSLGLWFILGTRGIVNLIRRPTGRGRDA